MTLLQPRPAGLIISPPVVEAALAQHLASSLEAYLLDHAAQLSQPAPQPPLSITIGGAFERFPEDQLPAVIVQAAGIDRFERPIRGQLSAWFRLRVGAAVPGPNEPATRLLLGVWMGSLLACLTQSASLGGVASELALVSADMAVHSPEARRSYQACWIDCRYLVHNAVQTSAGPLRNDQPAIPDPDATDVQAQLQPIGPQEEP